MNKKYMTLGLATFVLMSFAAAALVDYYGQQKVDMTIDAPVVLHSGDVEVSLFAGDGYNLYLVEGENFLTRDVDVKFQFSLLDGDGNALGNTDGFYLAYSDDVSYYFNAEHGSCLGPNTNGCGPAFPEQTMDEWMTQFPTWIDWYLTGELVDYDASVITNHGGNSAHENALPFNVAFGEDLSPGKFYAVIYLDVDEAVVPGDYTFSLDMMPVTQ